MQSEHDESTLSILKNSFFIARMLRREALVAVFVVAGFARHQLLLIVERSIVHFSDEVDRCCAAQRRDVFAVMRNPHVAVFVLAKREAKIASVVHDKSRLTQRSNRRTEIQRAFIQRTPAHHARNAVRLKWLQQFHMINVVNAA